MSNCGKAFSEWAGIQGLTSQRLRPRRRKQNTAIQTEALEDRVMLSAVLGSVDTQAVDLGGNLPTFSEFDASESGMATVDTSGHEEVVSSQKNDWTIIGNPSLETTVDTSGHEEVANSQKNGWIIAGNPSLQEQPGADGFWVAPSPESAAVVELSNQIDADSGDNMNQLGDVKGEATDKDHFVGPEGIKGEATDKDHK